MLDDNKAEDILTIDLRPKATVGEAMVIASGRSQRHVAALSDFVVKAVKEAGYTPLGVEGLPSADWVLIDTGAVIVHLFRPEVREFYKLEKIWAADIAAPPSA